MPQMYPLLLLPLVLYFTLLSMIMLTITYFMKSRTNNTASLKMKLMKW